jgi:hypothetical protein
MPGLVHNLFTVSMVAKTVLVPVPGTRLGRCAICHLYPVSIIQD